MDELIKALDTIKAECEKHTSGSSADECKGCPLATKRRGCGIVDYPCLWNIWHEGDTISLLE